MDPIEYFESVNYSNELDIIIEHLDKIDVIIENQELLNELLLKTHSFLEILATLFVAFFIWTIIRQLYNFFSGIFGGIF